MSRADDRQAVLDQALFLAVSNGDEKMIRHYLDEGADPNAPVDAGRSAFGVAVWLQMLDTAQDMLARGARINQQRDDGQGAPLWLAALFRDATKQTTARTQFCIRNGANFALTFKYGERTVGVLEALDEFRSVLGRAEREGLQAVRALVVAELAVVTRARQQQMGAKRRHEGGRYKL